MENKNTLKDNIKQFKKEFKNFFYDIKNGFKKDPIEKENIAEDIKEETLKNNTNTPNPNNKKERTIKKYRINLGKIFLGIIIISIGIIFLLTNLNIITIDTIILIEKILSFWPVLVIALGLSVLSGRGFITSIFGILFTIVLILFILRLFLGTNEVTKIRIPNFKLQIENNDIFKDKEYIFENPYNNEF